MASDDPRDGDGLLAIGAFSRASGLSIKTLRAYHDGAILVPDRVDARTGYRAYSPAQLADAAVIVRLRALDVPLEQVRRVLQARDPSLTRQVLEAHRAIMEARLEATVRIVAELQSGAAPLTLTPVHVRDEPATHSVRVATTARDDELWPWLEHAFADLEAVAHGCGAQVTGARTALYLPEIAEDGIEHVEAVIPLASPPPGPLPPRVAVGEVPAARTAVLVHAGSYEDIGDTYRALGAWVGRHAEPSGERIRERYVIGSPDGADPDAYRTEICWPIR